MINLDTQQPDQSGISLDEQKTTPVSSDVATTRATKTVFGTNVGYSDTFADIVSGREEQLRQRIAAEQKAKNAKDIADFMFTMQTPLTADQINEKFNKPIHPSSVIEDNYAKQYVNGLYMLPGHEVVDDNGMWSDAVHTIPDHVKRATEVGAELTFRREAINTYLEDAKAALQQQGWGGFLLDVGKSLTQVYPEAKLRDIIPGAEFGLGLGTALEKQRVRAFDMPRDEFVQALSNARQLIKDNPQMAVAFGEALQGQTSNEENINNAFSLFLPLDISAAAGLSKGVFNVAKASMLQRQVNAAAASVVKSVPNASATTVRRAAADAVGDNAVAGMRAWQDDLLAGYPAWRDLQPGLMDLKGTDPVKDGIDSLQSALKVNESELLQRPGNNGFEILNRLRESYGQFVDKIINAVINMSRVERIGSVLASEKVVKAAWDEIKNNYRGMANSIIQLNKPQYNPLTGGFNVDRILGREDGTFFSNIQEAVEWANLKGINIVKRPAFAFVSGASKSVGDVLRQTVVNIANPKAARDTISLSRLSGRKSAFWRSKNVDLPIEIVGEPVEGPGGRKFQKVKYEGTESFVPHDEIVFPSEGVATEVSGKVLRGVRPSKVQETDELINQQILGQKPIVKPTTGGVIHEATNLPGDVNIVGKRYYIALPTPLRETDSLIRDAISETAKSQKSNKGFFNSLGLPAWIRTPSEVLSEQEQINRIVAIHAPAVMKQVLFDLEAPLRAAKNRGKGLDFWKNFGKGSDFERFLKFGQQKIDSETGLPGYTWRNVSDFQEDFQKTIGRMPDPIEVEGYFTWSRTNDADWAFRNLALYRNMLRVGGETHQVWIKGTDGKKTLSDPFVGVKLKSLPSPSGPYGDAILLHDDVGFRGYSSSRILNSTRGKNAAKGLETGEYSLLDIYNRDQRPLQGWAGIGGESYRYILTKNVDTRPLEFNQLPRKGGGHLAYESPLWVKQARISVNHFNREEGKERVPVHRYEGDSTVMGVENNVLGQDIVDPLNKVAEYLWKGNLQAAKDVAINSPLAAIPWETVHGWFYSKKGPKGVDLPPRLDMQQKFYVVPNNKTIKDISNHFNDYKRFQDGTTSGSLARQFQVEFTSERDAAEIFSLRNEGTKANPLYSYNPTDMVDPITVLNRALTRVVDSIWMDDYKISSMEHWIQKALTAGPNGTSVFKESLNEVRGSPWHFFMNGKLKSGIDPAISNRLEAERWMIKSFNGVPSTIDAWVHGMQQTIVDTIYGSDSALIRTGALLSKYALAATHKAPAFLRSVAYRMDIGLFSIPQLIVQSQNYVSIYGIAGPVRATQGSVGALLHQYSRINANPEILQSLDKIAQRWGWKPNEWIEAREALTRTGFEYVSKETNVLMSHYNMSNNFVKSSWGTFLDAGEMPFKGGERHARYGAWYSTYKEKGLVGKATNEELNEITLRASMMAGDMTKASKSALQMGPLAFPTQFLGYTMRLFEQFSGKRLSKLEKGKLFGMYALAYGVPVASSAVFLGLPINETIKKHLVDLYPDEAMSANPIYNGLMNGLPAAIMYMVTGNRYNVPERLGPGNYDLYRDMLAGDKSIYSILSGPTGSVITSAFEATDPYFAWIGARLRGLDKSKPSVDDLVNIFKQTAAGNNFARLTHALNTGDWISRNENVIKQNITPFNAGFMTLTGLQPSEGTDARIIKAREEDQKKDELNGANMFTKNWKRGMLAVKNKDYDNADQYFNTAFTALDYYRYPIERRDALIASATDPDTLPDKVAWAFYTGRDVPAGMEKSRQETLARILQLRGNQ